VILPLVDSRLITLPRLSVLVTVPLLSVVDRPEALAAGIVALALMFGLFSIFGHDNTTTLAANNLSPLSRYHTGSDHWPAHIRAAERLRGHCRIFADFC
jgi:hypothetical protein